MNIIKKEGYSDLIEKKSRFLGHICSVSKKEELKGYLDFFRKEHPKANHVAYAYRLGLDTFEPGFSDDGEPSGTAGKPLLNHILYNDLTNCLIVSIRYFGGVKLGTGGLQKAYSLSAKTALQNSVIEPHIHKKTYYLECDYTFVSPIKTLFSNMDVEILNEKFAEQASFSFTVAVDTIDDFFSKINTIHYSLCPSEHKEFDSNRKKC